MFKKFAVLFIMAVVLAFSAVLISRTRDDIDRHSSCLHCGMDRKAYEYSRMLIQYEDGTEVGVCSIHCLAVDLNANSSRKVKSVHVADRNTHALLEAEKAIWVVGGSKRGVMTRIGKWAFGKKEDAESFIKTYGGKLTIYEEAKKAAYADIK